MSDHSEHVEEQPTTEDTVAAWVQQHGRTVIGGILLVLVALVGVYSWSQHSANQSHQDFMTAELQLRRLSEDVDGKQEALGKLTDLISQHDELRSKYDGLIAHELIKGGDAQKAQSYLESSIARSSRANGALHHKYGRASLLIADGKLEESLTHTLQLQEELAKDESEDLETLRVFNDLRLAFLYQNLGQAEKERLAWAELRADYPWLFGKKGGLTSTREAMLRHFSEGSVTLSDYATMRENSL